MKIIMLPFNVIMIQRGVGVLIDMDQWLKEHVCKENCPSVVSQTTTCSSSVYFKLVHQNVVLFGVLKL
jgi:hypothetical protein